MDKMISASSFFGVALSLAAYMIGLTLQKKFKKGIFNPLLISIVLVIGTLLITGIEYKEYNVSASYLGYLLTPTTICLAIPLYRKLDQLKKNFWAIIGGITSGAVTSMGSVFLLSLAFGLDHSMYATLLPKSITTAIGMVISGQNGGIEALTSLVIAFTGIVGCITGPILCKLLKLKNPIAQGVAFGTSAHVIGTSKASERGPIQGAVSSLSLAVAGILTALLFPFVVSLL